MNTLTDKQIEEILLGSQESVEANKERQKNMDNAYYHNKLASVVIGKIAEHEWKNYLNKFDIAFKSTASSFTNEGSDCYIGDDQIEVKANAWFMIAPDHIEKYRANDSTLIWYNVYLPTEDDEPVTIEDIKNSQSRLLGYNNIIDFDDAVFLEHDLSCPTEKRPYRKTKRSNYWLPEWEKKNGRPIKDLIAKYNGKEVGFEQVVLI
tara:strand:- start:165 stop:782 length:618 start_codon:yes stop_codon:yes gene_type:complete